VEGCLTATPRGILHTMSVDTAELTRRWRQSWPDCPPLGHVFRRHMPDRWVRFHFLPFGRRCPTTPADYDEILHRYNTVLAAMTDESDSAAIYLVTVDYGDADLAAGTEPIHTGLHPGAQPWMRVADPADPGSVYGVHVSRAEFTPGALDDLFRYVAEDRTSDVVIAGASLRWLFCPYDGGMDVIADSPGERERLAARFASWRSDRPDGL